MPYKRVDPVSEEEIADEGEMKRLRYEGHHTICQKCREIWRIGKETDNADLQMKSRITMAMAKKMQDKIKYYRDKYEGPKND